MTEEIIKSITAAEEQATKIKSDAQDRAAQILSSAQEKAAQTEAACTEFCKTYRETQLKEAQLKAEKEYEVSMQTKAAEAKAYCEEALQHSEASVGKIVGRILSGDR